MTIIETLHKEESKLKQQLVAIRGAIAAFNGLAPNRSNGPRTLSIAARAKMSRAAKVRWARIRAAKRRKRN